VPQATMIKGLHQCSCARDMAYAVPFLCLKHPERGTYVLSGLIGLCAGVRSLQLFTLTLVWPLHRCKCGEPRGFGGVLFVCGFLQWKEWSCAHSHHTEIMGSQVHNSAIPPPPGTGEL